MNRAFFFRRIGAMFYDGLLVVALCIIGTLPLLLFTQGQSISPANFYYKIYLMCLITSFYLWFWMHGGQTGGMKAWHLKLIAQSGKEISLKQAYLRLLIAIPSLALAGFGLFWAFWDKDGYSLYDRFSKTKLIKTS